MLKASVFLEVGVSLCNIWYNCSVHLPVDDLTLTTTLTVELSDNTSVSLGWHCVIAQEFLL